MEQEFQTQVFAKKIELYKRLLDAIFRMDDDNLIERSEVQEVENMVGSVALIASRDLVLALSRFILQLKVYGALYPRSLTAMQLQHHMDQLGDPKFPLQLEGIEASTIDPSAPVDVQRQLIASRWVTPDAIIECMRHDLGVVEGKIIEDIEKFVLIPYDRYKMVKDPNVVD